MIMSSVFACPAVSLVGMIGKLELALVGLVFHMWGDNLLIFFLIRSIMGKYTLRSNRPNTHIAHAIGFSRFVGAWKMVVMLPGISAERVCVMVREQGTMLR